MTGNPPVDVQALGQSIWLDNMSRHLITSGELQRLIDEDGVLGVTSNPTIFQKAIGGSSDYDEAMAKLLKLDSYEIFEALEVEDIRNALDLFRPTYDRTNGGDGYVSLEVSPLIANDTQTTTAEAIRLFKLVDRPNLMVKIPSTQAGIPSIEEATAAGVNVNITLIFGIANYEQVMEAFIRGLERRVAAGQDITRIHSVASFFLSRIDTAVDRILDSNIRAAQGRDLARVTLNNRLKGKAAIANAKVAYKHFLKVFYGERFAALKAKGGHVQRVLWASTSTKNPTYPDTMYIDSLIGKDTVNTVPPATLKDFKDHGTVADTLTQGMDEAAQTLDMLAEAGVSLDQVTMQLQSDAVEAFSESYHSLLAHVDAKRDVLQTGISKQQDAALGVYQDSVDQTLKSLDTAQANERIWQHDGSLWKDNPQVIAKINDRLGWLDTLKTIDLARLKKIQSEAKAAGLGHVVLLGMGGSSLAPEVLFETFGAQAGFPRLLMLDSTDPQSIKAIEDAINLDRTWFIVSSKSGGTIETLSFFQYFYEKASHDGSKFIAITDPGTSLETLARDKGFRDTFSNPPDIGGRYSALSYFGMLPAALIGLDLDAIWANEERMMKANGPKIDVSDHPGLWLGAIMGTLGLQGRDKVTIITSPSIAAFGNWVEQLIAESTGKEGRGLLPVVGASVGKPHDFSSDRLFIYLKVEGDDNEETDAGIRALREAGHPRVTLRLPDKHALFGEFFRWEYAVAVVGKVLAIPTFDEPNVTESKQNTARLLDYYKEHGALPATEPVLVEDNVSLYADEKMIKIIYELCTQHNYTNNTLTGMLAAPINATAAGDYFALMAYTPMTAETTEQFRAVARRLRHVTRRAVTLGFGPRFLHSTGQFHKGGPNSGVFIQITTDKPFDLAIPGAPYSFATLQAAQAAGDLEALIGKNRRVLRLHISGDLKAGLDKLVAAIDAAGERRQ